MPRTVASLINDFNAPEQPDDCREASRRLLVEALTATGPVAHDGKVVSLGKEGSIAVEPRKYERIAATTVVDDEGNTVEVPAREPTEAEIAQQWGVPLAGETPAPDAPARRITPNPPAQES